MKRYERRQKEKNDKKEIKKRKQREIEEARIKRGFEHQHQLWVIRNEPWRQRCSGRQTLCPAVIYPYFPPELWEIICDYLEWYFIHYREEDEDSCRQRVETEMLPRYQHSSIEPLKQDFGGSRCRIWSNRLRGVVNSPQLPSHSKPLVSRPKIISRVRIRE